MAIDNDFVKNFQNQIDVLESMKKAIDGAIERANGRLKQVVDEGKSVEEVFGPVPPKK